MPLRSAAVYKFLGKQVPFEIFFKNFLESIRGVDTESGFKVHGYEGSEEEKAALEKYKEMRKKRESDTKNYNSSSHFYNFYSSPERFEVPYLSIVKDLLLCLKEDLVSELVVISSVRKRGFDSEGKEKKFKKTFANFPQAKIEINEFVRLPVNIEGQEVASHPDGKITPTR